MIILKFKYNPKMTSWAAHGLPMGRPWAAQRACAPRARAQPMGDVGTLDAGKETSEFSDILKEPDPRTMPM